MRLLFGKSMGATVGDVIPGPVKLHGSFETTGGGRADEISAGDGEVLVLVRKGTPESYAHWIRGTRAELQAYIRAQGDLFAPPSGVAYDRQARKVVAAALSLD